MEEVYSTREVVPPVADSVFFRDSEEADELEELTPYHRYPPHIPANIVPAAAEGEPRPENPPWEPIEAPGNNEPGQSDLGEDSDEPEEIAPTEDPTVSDSVSH